MKTFRHITLLTLLASALSCTSNFEEYNTNPNEAPMWTITPGGLLQEIVYGGTNDIASRTWYLVSDLMQYTVTGGTNNQYHRYIIGTGIMGSAWNSCFVWAGNADHMFRLARRYDPEDADPVYNNYKAIALTMKCLYMANATDIFGDVPCSQAFAGRDGEYRPAFDTQEEIYHQLYLDLELANTLYDPSKGLTRNGQDLLYGGDISKWRKFNNSLYLRLLMRMSNRAEQMEIAEKLTEIFSDPAKYPVFESNGDNATVFFSGSIPFINKFGNQTENGFRHNAAEYTINLLTAGNDPRLPLMYEKYNSSSDWKGQVSGESLQDVDGTNISRLNRKVLGQYDSPFSLMKYDEVLFIRAEAIKRGFVPGTEEDVAACHADAIRASIRYWESIDPDRKEITDARIDAYINSYGYYDGELSKILTQKFIAQFFVGYEPWNDYRRTGFPVLRIGSATAANAYTLPTRLSYPTATRTTNPENYAKAVERLRERYNAEDNMRAPVWWSLEASRID